VVLLPLALVLLVIILFSRIKYRADFSANGGFAWHGKVRYLGIRAEIGNEQELNIYFLSKKVKLVKTKKMENTQTETEIEKAVKKSEKLGGVEKPEKAEDVEKVKAADSKDSKEGIFAKIREAGFGEVFGHSKQMLGRVFRAIWPRRLEIGGEIGFEDPSTTGQVLAAIYGGGQILRRRGTKIQIEGNFDEEVIRLNGRASGHFRLITIAFAVLRWYLKKPIRALFS